MDSSNQIKIENLIKFYGKNARLGLERFRAGGTRDSILQSTGNLLAVADVSFTVKKGELFVLMGLSGSGKSTLIRCINRLIAPTSGHIYIDGEDIAHVDEKRMREIRLIKMSMVFQNFGLFPHKTVLDNVEYGLKMQGMDKGKRRHKALETLELVGLSSWANYFPSSLSGGMQQRVGLARALATDAEILLMDEPFSALDPLIRRLIQDELLLLQKKLHKTIVFISHDIHEALKIGDRIAFMKDGRIVQIGTPEELITQPVDGYIRAFMQNVNRASFLKTGAIARQIIPLIVGQDSAKTALEQMIHHDLKQMYVINQHGKPVGVVKKQLLKEALQKGCEDIIKIMQTDFPLVKASTKLENIFHLYQQGLPVAVVDGEGKLKGVVEQSDVLASISISESSTHQDRSQQV